MGQPRPSVNAQNTLTINGSALTTGQALTQVYWAQAPSATGAIAVPLSAPNVVVTPGAATASDAAFGASIVVTSGSVSDHLVASYFSSTVAADPSPPWLRP